MRKGLGEADVEEGSTKESPGLECKLYEGRENKQEVEVSVSEHRRQLRMVLKYLQHRLACLARRRWPHGAVQATGTGRLVIEETKG